MSENTHDTSSKISRRDFLKLAGTTVGTVATGFGLGRLAGAAKEIWQPKVVDLGVEALKNPKGVEITLATSATFLEELALTDRRDPAAPKIEKNLNYCSITTIIGEVLEKRYKEGKPISYQKVSDYQGIPYYLDKLRIAAHDPKNRDTSLIKTGELSSSSYILGYKPDTLSYTIQEKEFFPKKVRTMFYMSDLGLNMSYDFMERDTGFWKRAKDILGEESAVLWGIDSWDDEEFRKAIGYYRAHSEEIDRTVRNYLTDIKGHIERIVTEKHGPVSAGEIFAYCLDRNNGDVGESLADTTLFLKYMARNDTTFSVLDEVKLDPEKSKENEEWFRKNILDEYGRVGSYSNLPHKTYPYKGILSRYANLAYSEVDKDFHLLNQIGKPYHVWNIVMVDTAVPPMIVQLGVAYRQGITFSQQGPIKTAADFRAALELNKLEALSQRYTK